MCTVLEPDYRVYQQVMLETWRKAQVYSGREVIAMGPTLLADAMHMDKKRMRLLWESIRTKWRNIYEHGTGN